MREIKFRAWDKRDVENPPSMSYFDLSEGNMYKRCGNIMQYTGLKDKNGKEIYEGDIVEYCNGTIAKVLFNTGQFLAYDGHATSSDEAYCLLHDDSPPFMDGFELKIIGNIYENPELL